MGCGSSTSKSPVSPKGPDISLAPASAAKVGEEAPVVAKAPPPAPAAPKASMLAEKVERIKAELGLDDSLKMAAAVKKANEAMGLEAVGTMADQVSALLEQLGVEFHDAPAAAAPAPAPVPEAAPEPEEAAPPAATQSSRERDKQAAPPPHATEKQTERADEVTAAAERNVQRAGEVLEIVSKGLDLASTVLKVGKHLPVIGGVCEAATDVLDMVKEYSDKLSDVQAAGQRVLDLLEFLEMMGKNVKKIAAEDLGSVEARMEKLESLLLELKEFLAVFGKPGWLKRAWSLRSAAKTLTSLDDEISGELTALEKRYNLATMAHMSRQFELLLNSRPYPLEAAITERVDQRIRDDPSQSQEGAAEALQGDLQVLLAVAKEAKVCDKEILNEILEFRQEVPVHLIRSPRWLF